MTYGTFLQYTNTSNPICPEDSSYNQGMSLQKSLSLTQHIFLCVYRMAWSHPPTPCCRKPLALPDAAIITS